MRLEKHRGKWAVRLESGNRLSTGVPYAAETRQAAERKAASILSHIAAQRGAATLGEVMDAYISDMKERAKVVVRQDTARYAMAALLPFWGDMGIEEITYERCRAYIKESRRNRLSDATIRQRLKYLRAAVNWHSPGNDAKFDFPPPPSPRRSWVTQEDFAALVKAASGSPHIVLFMHLAIATCARKEAILQLRWDTHVDMDKRLIWLGFKSGGKKRSTVPMTDTLYETLKVARAFATCDHVIEYHGGPVKDVRKGLVAAFRAAGVDHGRQPAHIFRHSAAVWMAQAGVSMVEIKERMGHSSISVTETHYAKFYPEYMKDSNKALDM